MANDLNVNEFKLRDPVRNIPDGLKEPVKDSTPGFFQSLRNPYHLMLEESLPASLYQWITGNTKKKQAQEALDWIRNNPDQQGSKIYQEAERKLKRFGYLLEEGPMSIDMKEVGNMIKANPKLFGAELVNMLMADPWLLFMPLGWHRLGRSVVNAIRLKRAKNLSLATVSAKKAAIMSDLKVGATATLAIPFVFSSTWQLAEDRTLDPKRTAIETTIGASAGALLSVGFAGMGALAQRMTQLPRARIIEIQSKVLKKHGVNPEKLLDYNKNGIFRGVDELIEEIKTQTNIILDPKKFEAIKADMTVALRAINENGKDMAFNTALKTGASLAAIGATAQFLTAEDKKLLATAKGAGAGVAVYLAGRFLASKLRQMPKDFDAAALSAEATLDAAKMSTVRLNSAAYELGNKIKQMLPDAIDSRRKVFYYLTRAKVDRKTFEYNGKLKPIADIELSGRELEAAKAIRKVFNEFEVIFGKEGGRLLFNSRANYLPLLWTHYNPKIQPFQFVKDFDQTITGPSGKFQFAKRGVFGDINAGLQRNFKIKPGYDDPAELIKIYANAAGKALSTRALITSLEKSKIEGLPLLIRRGQAPINQNYTQFKHPYFESKDGFPYIHKGMEKSLRMVFDATDEAPLMSALFTTNLMMKRLAVGFSFFHAGALVESMWFAGAKPKFIKKVLSPNSKVELEALINNPQTYIKDFPHAIKVLNQLGFRDVVQFARGTGLQISTPEDIGFDRFYYNLRGIDTAFKRHFGISTGGRAEKTFKWFDRITWDRIFTQAKLHTFLTALNKNNIMGKPNPMRIMPGDNQARIYQKATQASQFANDAFGGQNWEQLANRIQTPWLKNILQTTFAPGSRGYMQLLMFAPDWTISNVRIIAKSLPAFESDPGLRRLYQYYFAKAALTYAAAGSVLNYAFSGHSILENTDPTRIDLGDGEVLTFSKQLMEPFHWITAPQSTGLKKIGSLPRVVIETLTNKQYLTTKWSPNITKKDDEAIAKGLKIGGHVGRRFLPIWLQTATQNVSEGLKRDGLSADLAADTAVNFVLGQLGHPRYQGPRYTQYKTKGLVRSPYETLF
jgi:hypothetical protein